MIKTKVAVIGGGPIGLFSSLLLQHFNIDHVTLQKFDKPRSHPSAHWVSARSKQILSQIPNLAQKIDQNQQSFQLFRHYRYCQTLLGFQFGFKDHFESNISKRLQKSKQIYGQYPNHISQGKLLQIMYENIQQKDRIVFNQNISLIQQNGNTQILYNQDKQKVCEAEYVLLSNGVRSTLRDQLGIKMQGENQLFNIINIHFQSKKLAECINKSNLPAMLHFVWNKKMPSILVNHSYQTGTFVLQIPNYQPFLDLTKVYTPRQLISTILQKQHWQDIQNDINIIHVGKWKLQALIANKLRHNNTFLVGDTAHTFTPAGGFGMNSGFQDAHQIIHFLHFASRNQQCNKQNLFNLYDNQRKQTDLKYLKKSIQNYKITKQISQKLGFPSNLTQGYINFSNSFPQYLMNILPQSKNQIIQQIRLKFMSFMYKRSQFQPQLQLFFDQFDLKSSNLSSKFVQISNKTKNNQVKDLYVDESINLTEVEKIFGRMNPQNIQFIKTNQKNSQKIIRRDGIFM